MEVNFNSLPEAVSLLFRKVENIEKLLLSQSSNPKSSGEEQLMTIEQASSLLNLAKPTLYGFTQRNLIPFCKKGRRVYFSKAELLDWVQQGRKRTNAEIAAEAHNYFITKKRLKNG